MIATICLVVLVVVGLWSLYMGIKQSSPPPGHSR